MSFVKRKIDLTFTLSKNLAADGSLVDPTQPAQPTFAGSNGANILTVSGLRVTAQITETGGKLGAMAIIRVFGLTLSVMNQLSTWGKLQTQISRNSVSVMTGDDDSGMSLIFQGTITDAMIDFNNAPEVVFQMSAFTAVIPSLTAGKSTTYNAIADVSTLMQDLATRAGYKFQNYGVTSRIAYPYYSGTYGDQMDAIARDANIEYDTRLNIVSIWPKGQAKQSQVLLVSPTTGMKGYPTFYPLGINVEMEHSPNVGYGSQIKVQSSLQPACGDWIVTRLQHDLAAEVPDGPWFTSLQANKPGTALVAT